MPQPSKHFLLWKTSPYTYIQAKAILKKLYRQYGGHPRGDQIPLDILKAMRDYPKLQDEVIRGVFYSSKQTKQKTG